MSNNKHAKEAKKALSAFKGATSKMTLDNLTETFKEAQHLLRKLRRKAELYQREQELAEGADRNEDDI